MAVNGRRKGKAGEREAAEILRQWWDPVEPGVKFASAPLSGGWHSAQMRGALRLCGDLVTSSATWPWVVEVKRREGFSLDRLLRGAARSPVYGWWEQAKRAAIEARAAQPDVVPLLMFRKSRSPWLCVVPTTVAIAHLRVQGQWKWWPLGEGGAIVSLDTFLGAGPTPCVSGKW